MVTRSGDSTDMTNYDFETICLCCDKNKKSKNHLVCDECHAKYTEIEINKIELNE